MAKIEIRNIRELKERFNKAIETLPQYYQAIYSDFEKFAGSSLELSVQALEQIAKRHKRARANDYAS